MTDPFQTVCQVLGDIFGLEPGELHAASTMDEVEGWDSFSHLQAIAALEEEFGVRFVAWRIPEINSVEKLAIEVASLLSERR